MTGYIAGDALFVLHQAHPEFEYAALVRTQDKADKVKAAYSNVRIVLGSLDDSDVLEREAAAADIVLRMSPKLSITTKVSLLARRYGIACASSLKVKLTS